MNNLAMDNVITQLAATDLPTAMLTALESYARGNIEQSVVLLTRDQTFLTAAQRTGVNRWVTVIDDTAVTGIMPTPVESFAAGRVGRRASEPPMNRRRSDSASRARVWLSNTRSTEFRDTTVNLPRLEEGDGSGRGSSPENEQTSERGEQEPPAEEDDSSIASVDLRKAGPSPVDKDLEERGKRRSKRKSKEMRAADKSAAKAARKEEERLRKGKRDYDRRARKAEKKAKKKGKGRKRRRITKSSSGSDSDSSEDSPSDTSCSDSTSDSNSSSDSSVEYRGRNERRTFKLPFKFKAGRLNRKWRKMSAKKKARMAMDWKAALSLPKVWFAVFGSRIVLNRQVSRAHAWKLTLTWATDLELLDCNLNISNMQAKSAKDIEETLMSSARRRVEYFAYRSALLAAVETWLATMPWLKREIERYLKQMDSLWVELEAQFAPKVFIALQRLQAAHRWMMRELDRNPYTLIGDKRLFRTAVRRYTAAGYNPASEPVFEPGRWLDNDYQYSMIAEIRGNKPGPAPRGHNSATTDGSERRDLGRETAQVQYCLEWNNSPNGCSRPNCRLIHGQCASGRYAAHGCGTPGPYRLCTQRGHEGGRAGRAGNRIAAQGRGRPGNANVPPAPPANQ
jgi:hypothetical protein